MIKVGLIPNKIFTLACQSLSVYHITIFSFFQTFSELSEVFLEFFYNIPFSSKSSKKKPILRQNLTSDLDFRNFQNCISDT